MKTNISQVLTVLLPAKPRAPKIKAGYGDVNEGFDQKALVFVAFFHMK